jgi:hypothetical protein
VAGGLWHLSIDDLFGPTGDQTRLGGPGPFVINLSASSAPINIPATPLAGGPHAHVYQIQRYEDGRVRYRLRLGAFYKEEDMDPVLEQVRESYPSALSATAGPDDLLAIETLCAKVDARRRAAAPKVLAEIPRKVAIPQVSESRPAIAAAPATVTPSTDFVSEDSNSLAQLVDTITLLTAQLKQLQPIAEAPPVATSIPTLEHAVSATRASAPTEVKEADVPPAVISSVAQIGSTRPAVTEDSAQTSVAPALAAATSAPMTPVSASAPTVASDLLTLEPVVVAAATPRPAAVTVGPATKTSAADDLAVAPETAREETFVLELVKDTPVVTSNDTGEPASVTYPQSLGIEVTPFLAVAAQQTATERTDAVSIAKVAAPKPAPPAARLPLFANFVRQALRRMPLARATDADIPPAKKTPSAAPKGLDSASAAQSVTADAPRASSPAALAKPATAPTRPAAAAMRPQANPVRVTTALHQKTAAAKTPAAQPARDMTRAPANPTGENSKVPGASMPTLEIASTQTVRALTQHELVDQSALRWFVVELSTADSEFLPESIPQLDIYSAYRLYTVNTFDQGREVHSLRLGFFGDEISAKTVAGYVAEYYEKPAVKRISIAERRRFEERGVEARKDVGATGKYAVIEITDELVVRDSRLQGLPS